jgi:hypothetical protein
MGKGKWEKNGPNTSTTTGITSLSSESYRYSRYWTPYTEPVPIIVVHRSQSIVQSSTIPQMSPISERTKVVADVTPSFAASEANRPCVDGGNVVDSRIPFVEIRDSTWARFLDL